ncbi:MAG: amidohydrolase family protein [Mucilaginibacter polytrichastri]|nr:amidohydrolase family protein [Mucilaginibacter polytrichastri]
MFKSSIFFSALLLILGSENSFAQDVPAPAKAQQKAIAITGATIHTGTGQVIENGTIVFDKGKIVSVAASGSAPSGAEIIDAKGKHVYPGIIAPVTNLGLAEIESVKATIDYAETGEINPHVRSIIAYNTDSKVIPTVRSNGVLIAQPTPSGGLLSGQSSIVQLDAWNWEDAAYRTDVGIHIKWPTAQIFTSRFAPPADQQKERYQENMDMLQQYFREAKAYASLPDPAVQNPRFEAVKGIFNGSKKVFIHTDLQKDILLSVQFFRKLGITPVLVSGEDARFVTGFLKENNVPVILHESHALPGREDDPVYTPYSEAKQLTDSGVLCAISIDGYWQQRNLPFMAGTTAAHGLNKEQALATITLNSAKILGIDKTLGSLETGKDATLFISTGDALDMRGNHVERAFISGRDIDLNNHQTDLYKKFSAKYGQEIKM